MRKFSLFLGCLSLLAVFLFAACSAAPIEVRSDNAPTLDTPSGADFTSEVLVGIVGVAMSLAFAYVPGLREKYDALDAAGKARVMAVCLVVASLVVFGLACANILYLFGLMVACTADSAVGIFRILLAALVANQAAFVLLVKPYKRR